MSKIIKNCGISTQYSNKSEESVNKIVCFSPIDINQEKFKDSSFNQNSFNISQKNELNKINFVSEKEQLNDQNKRKKIELNHSTNTNKKIQNIFFIRKEKKLKKMKRHCAISKDNIIQTIIRDFINFFTIFINLVLKQKIKKEKAKIEKIQTEKLCKINIKEIQFKIRYEIKEKIKVKDILNLTVEKMLLLDEIKNQEKKIDLSKSDDNLFQNINSINTNKNRLKIFRTFFDSSLDIFFKTRVISLFKDIYIKNKKKIDLKIYGIPGIILHPPKYMPTFKKLKKMKKNKPKEEIMNLVVKNKFINPKRKRIKFKIIKKE